MSDHLISLAKLVQSGEVSASDLPHGSADVFLSALQKAATLTQRAGESGEQAFWRYATQDCDGRALIAAHSTLSLPRARVMAEKSAAGFADVRKAKGCKALELRAAKILKLYPHLTDAQAFARAMEDPRSHAVVAAALGNVPVENPGIAQVPTCCWPMWGGDARAPLPPIFCDAAVDLHVYCKEHAALAYGKWQAVTRDQGLQVAP